jgi:hypothetical protein
MRKQQMKALLLCGFVGIVLSYFPGSFVTRLTEIISIAAAMQMVLDAAKRK